MGVCGKACLWFLPLYFLLLVYCFSWVITLQITQPFWYKPFSHGPDSPEQFGDHHLPPLFHAFDYPAVDSPSLDFLLGYEHIEIPTAEIWKNPRTQQEEAMKIRGWYISFHHMHNHQSNREKVIATFKEQGLTDEEINEQCLQHIEKKEGIVGIHGAAVDRRELLKHTLFWLTQGFEVMIADCRDHGISDGYNRGPSFGLREHEDVETMVDYARETLGWKNLIVFGSSQGGASSILGMNRLIEHQKDGGISCMVIENAFATKTALWSNAIKSALRGKKFGRTDTSKESALAAFFQNYGGKYIPDFLLDLVVELVHINMGFPSHKLDPVDAVHQFENLRVLYLHGLDDTVVKPDHSSMLYENTSAKEKEIQFFEGGVHASLSVQFPTEYAKIMSAFLGKCHGVFSKTG